MIIEFPTTRPKKGPIADAIANYERVTTQRAEAAQRVHACRIAVETATESDRAALGAALATGKPDPGPTRVREAEAELADAQRQHDGLESAGKIAHTALVAALGEHRATWLELLAADVTAARSAYLEALDRLAEADAAAARAVGALAWLNVFPKATVVKASALRVRALNAPSGEPYTTTETIAHLRATADALAAPATTPAIARTPRVLHIDERTFREAGV